MLIYENLFLNVQFVGRVLYEMSDTKITLEARRFRSGRNRKKEMLQKLEECRKTSAEAAACLRYRSIQLTSINEILG